MFVNGRYQETERFHKGVAAGSTPQPAISASNSALIYVDGETMHRRQEMLHKLRLRLDLLNKSKCDVRLVPVAHVYRSHHERWWQVCHYSPLNSYIFDNGCIR